MKFSDTPDGCIGLFQAWKPLVQALDDHYNACLRQKGVLMQALNELIAGVVSVYPHSFRLETSFYDNARCSIGYAHFSIPNSIASPLCKRNVVLIPLTKVSSGPLLEIKAVTPLQAGQKVSLRYILSLCTGGWVTYSNNMLLNLLSYIMLLRRICLVMQRYWPPSASIQGNADTAAPLSQRWVRHNA